MICTISKSNSSCWFFLLIVIAYFLIHICRICGMDMRKRHFIPSWMYPRFNHLCDTHLQAQEHRKEKLLGNRERQCHLTSLSDLKPFAIRKFDVVFLVVAARFWCILYVMMMTPLVLLHHCHKHNHISSSVRKKRMRRWKIFASNN